MSTPDVRIQRPNQRRQEEIAEWAAEHAGTDLDLNPDLERAGLEVFENKPSSRDGETSSRRS
jgi:hypothetical protein